MFNVDDQIRVWTANLAEPGTLTSEKIAELEGHLRETMVSLSTKGLSPTEAFSVASMRIGHSDLLIREFSKVNGNHVWQKQTRWMLCGYVGGLRLRKLDHISKHRHEYCC